VTHTLRTLLWCALVAFVGEVLIAPAIAIFGVAPDFAVIALLMLALAQGALGGCIGGCLLGLVQDLASPHLLGLNALCKTFVGYASGRVRGHLLFGLPVVEASLVAVAVLAHDALYLLVESRFGFAAFFRPFLLHALPSALYSGLAGLPLLRLAARLGVLGRDE
jgi:rod shape-determining protein MreD